MTTQFRQLADRLNAITDSLGEVGRRLDAEVVYDPTFGKGQWRTRPDGEIRVVGYNGSKAVVLKTFATKTEARRWLESIAWRAATEEYDSFRVI